MSQRRKSHPPSTPRFDRRDSFGHTGATGSQSSPMHGQQKGDGASKYRISGPVKASFMTKKKATVTGPKRVSLTLGKEAAKSTELTNVGDNKAVEKRDSQAVRKGRSSSAFSPDFATMGHDPDDPDGVQFVMYDTYGEAAARLPQTYSIKP